MDSTTRSPDSNDQVAFSAQPHIGCMSEYPRLAYSMKDVRRAGEALKAGMIWTDATKPEIVRTFRIINSYRDAHLYPMRSLRSSVAAGIRYCAIAGVTSARPKRLVSIRDKLRRSPGKLDQMQDLAGVRAVVHDMASAKSLIERCQTKTPHQVQKEYDYILNAKPDGYRSYHIVYRFSSDDDEFNGRRVELQIRTRIQHSWATAVEAVGLLRGENFKGGGGDDDWRRLFTLMSEEFAIAEGVREIDRSETQIRRAELRRLNIRLDAVSMLERSRQAVNYTEQYVLPTHRPQYYLLKFDRLHKVVTVTTYSAVDSETAAFHEAEIRAEENGDATATYALVEVEAIDKLKSAYPNYFIDVEAFAKNLSVICDGSDFVEYSLPKQAIVLRTKSAERPIDLSWFKRHRI
ncbi:hypothetical protein ATO13_08691 [Stappia sp. 22II-S9-Z10]|nr:hypothetical protein ATO13_08691 [Stappia sp. 22II-S9-Z10]